MQADTRLSGMSGLRTSTVFRIRLAFAECYRSVDKKAAYTPR
jgi:hypothetical protein